MAPIYSTLVTTQFAKTVDFYEDHFGFVPVVEKEGYAFLQSPDNGSNCIAVFDNEHECVRGNVNAVQGLILNIAMADIGGMYDYLYMEGIDVYKEPGTDIMGRKHFVITDPNGVLVNVYEPAPIAKAELVDA